MKNSIIKMSKDLGTPSPFNLADGLLQVMGVDIGTLLILCILLAFWQGLSLIYSPLILPGPVLTIKSLIQIFQSNGFFAEVFVTLKRLLAGLMESVAVGSILGILMGGSKRVRSRFEPLIYFIQSIPPILYMALAMIWFGLDGQATVFIIFIASAPVMAVNIKEGFENIDIKLIEMGKAFKFSRLKMIIEIIIPSLKTYFKSGLIIVVGLGWKLVVMGEVLSSGTGLGAQITDARMNLETNKVFAWGIIVILLCFLSQKFTAIILDLKPLRRKKYDFENE